MLTDSKNWIIKKPKTSRSNSKFPESSLKHYSTAFPVSTTLHEKCSKENNLTCLYGVNFTKPKHIPVSNEEKETACAILSIIKF